MTDKKNDESKDPIMQRTLVLVKPDGVQRGLIGRIIQRFEDVGLKIVGAKMVWIDKDFGKKHYFDIAQRRGEQVLNNLLKFMTEGPVMALCLEGVNAVENVRKIVGSTEPKSAMPGTIRGDFAHHSYESTDGKGVAVRNLIHASGKYDEAQYEVKLWFTPEELHTYKTVHEIHTF
ncbi:MAG: nucleoside-diphosphate kinase [Candidatus Woesearchaeota archaeon]